MDHADDDCQNQQCGDEMCSMNREGDDISTYAVEQFDGVPPRNQSRMSFVTCQRKSKEFSV